MGITGSVRGGLDVLVSLFILLPRSGPAACRRRPGLTLELRPDRTAAPRCVQNGCTLFPSCGACMFLRRSNRVALQKDARSAPKPRGGHPPCAPPPARTSRATRCSSCKHPSWASRPADGTGHHPLLVRHGTVRASCCLAPETTFPLRTVAKPVPLFGAPTSSR